jgi:hypothetical protein
MPDQRDPDKVAVTFYVPRDLKAAVRAKANEKGETVTDALVRALRRYVR